MDPPSDLGLRHPDLQALLVFWQAKAAGRSMPLRSDIDVSELRRWLGYLVLLDVIDGGADFHYRVHGTSLVRIIGVDMTGRRLSSAPAHLTAVFMAEYRATIGAGRPLYFEQRSPPSDTILGWVKLILPLSRHGTGIDQLLALVKPIAARAFR